MAGLRRSRRIATSAARIAKPNGALPASRSAMDSSSTANVKAREEQEKSDIYRSTRSMKRPAPVEDVLSSLPNLTRKKQKTGRKILRKRKDQAYKPPTEKESEEELEPPDKKQASSTTDEGLDIEQTTAPKKAKARKSVRFEDLSSRRPQRVTQRTSK